MIIFISGSINSGKSTLAKLLSQRLSHTALVEADAFHEMIPWMPIDEAVPINLEQTVAVLKIFAANNISVIVPYPLSQRNYQFLKERLADIQTPMHFFTLSPRLEIALTNRGGRELTDWEKGRIKHHYEIGIATPDFGEIIDNSNKGPEEVAKYILGKLPKR